MLDDYNALAKSCTGLRQARAWDEGRQKHARARIGSLDPMTVWAEMLGILSRSPYLLDRSKQDGWRTGPDLDWLLTPANWAKVMEGKYEVRVEAPKTPVVHGPSSIELEIQERRRLKLIEINARKEAERGTSTTA